jgi:hypothetical protein
MPTLSFQNCNDVPSYFSEKCSECSFACLKGSKDRPNADLESSPGTLSLPGFAAVIAGGAASVAGYPEASAVLAVAGAAAIVIKIIKA